MFLICNMYLKYTIACEHYNKPTYRLIGSNDLLLHL